MRLIQASAAASLVLAVSVGSAFAAGTSGAASNSLGIDVSKAGSTAQQQTAFFNALPASQQTDVKSRCQSMTGASGSGSSGGASATGTPDAQTMSFCQAILQGK